MPALITTAEQPQGMCAPARTARHAIRRIESKSFLVLFFKKEPFPPVFYFLSKAPRKIRNTLLLAERQFGLPRAGTVGPGFRIMRAVSIHWRFPENRAVAPF